MCLTWSPQYGGKYGNVHNAHTLNVFRGITGGRQLRGLWDNAPTITRKMTLNPEPCWCAVCTLGGK